MGKATLAQQRAIGEIGQARAQKLIDAGLVVLFVTDYERLKERVAELERRCALLRDLALGVGAQKDDIAAQVLKAAMEARIQ